ncbi:hypothetical protein K438DRAFT_2064776 [Mycena galopus ATCC 62051]|nr:hypothetical protein K438DRAFT_2064776 [Mycena galopus ATCC 62051]
MPVRERIRLGAFVPLPSHAGYHLIRISSSVIDLGKATENELAELTAACQKATFGVGGADVFDESYRKAGKMDLGKFAACFDVSGLLETISPDIMQGQNTDEDKFLKAEMYKLNVYGPGSFFKAHKDTPRSDDMIGSLVVIFPTTHAGGALTLEHAEKTWVFDSAADLASAATASLGYVAFYSDVTHAVEPVRAGYRVTLTYNLFLTDRRAGLATSQRHAPGFEPAFESALRTLLVTPAFLPAGGLLAYGLAHQYPFPAPPKLEYVQGKRAMPPSRLGPMLRLLKGNDARIRTGSEHIGLSTHVKVLYDSGENYDIDIAIDGKDSGKRVEETEDTQGENSEDPATAVGIPVHWVTKITNFNRVGSSYIAYGNDASIQHVYGNAALFVQVPAFGEGVRARKAE